MQMNAIYPSTEYYWDIESKIETALLIPCFQFCQFAPKTGPCSFCSYRKCLANLIRCNSVDLLAKQTFLLSLCICCWRLKESRIRRETKVEDKRTETKSITSAKPRFFFTIRARSRSPGKALSQSTTNPVSTTLHTPLPLYARLSHTSSMSWPFFGK